ncbi:MAG: hypothetical protein U0840_16275 [Gemmataceae bacterium]
MAQLTPASLLNLAQLQRARTLTPYLVLGYNDLGMHCMNQDFSEICILPPFNTLRAQVIYRGGEEPRIVTTGVNVSYAVPTNTFSVGKTNFWTYAEKLFGKKLAPEVGLTGNRLKGSMKPTGQNDWAATGIPITPLDDHLNLNPYPIANIGVVNRAGQVLGSTVAVVPVSWEISCNLCHTTKGISVATDILRRHDKKHGTQLEKTKPVLCASCHADPALGTTGVAGVKTLSHAMHTSHAPRMGVLPATMNSCYACHPGGDTQCQRDVHIARGIKCVDCHGDMKTVGDIRRRPWIDEPSCKSCHQKRKPNFQFEEPGKLFKDSRGHGGVHCAACHGPPHAITPTVTAADNLQAVLHQGTTGVIRDCLVCHRKKPDEPFFHSLDDDGAEKAIRTLNRQANKTAKGRAAPRK